MTSSPSTIRPVLPFYSHTVGFTSHFSHAATIHLSQASSANFGAQDETASATVRKILFSPIMFVNLEAWSLSITTGPGFARMSCETAWKLLVR